MNGWINQQSQTFKVRFRDREKIRCEENKSFLLVRAEFLNLSTTDIWGKNSFCLGQGGERAGVCCTVLVAMFSSVGPWLLATGCHY